MPEQIMESPNSKKKNWEMFGQSKKKLEMKSTNCLDANFGIEHFALYVYYTNLQNSINQSVSPWTQKFLNFQENMR